MVLSLFLSYSLGEASCYVVRTLKQTHVESQVVGN